MEIPTFRPTEEEFGDFEKYLSGLTQRCHPAVGLARVVPPKAWLSRVLLSQQELEQGLARRRVSAPVRQKVEKQQGQPGVFKVVNEVVQHFMPLARYREEAERQEASAVKYLDGVDRSSFEATAPVFWNALGKGIPAVYGADTPGTLFKPSLPAWNLDRLPSILRLLKTEIAGVTHSYLYFGMWKALFAAHTEDMELYSINFLHDGAPKMWYAVPPAAAGQFEALAARLFPDEHAKCAQFLRHKTFMFAPEVLAQHGVPYCCGAQQRGEFMITFPRAYHWGFNAGPNIAEAVNFALDNWIPFGKEAERCRCKSDTVRIDMEIFLFRYISWLRETGRLPPIREEAEWRFECPCGMHVSSDDPEFLWPCKPQFQCDRCHLWVHLECHEVSAVGNVEYCYYCKQEQKQELRLASAAEAASKRVKKSKS
jgi:jumonji domain-containing protein 2